MQCTSIVQTETIATNLNEAATPRFGTISLQNVVTATAIRIRWQESDASILGAGRIGITPGPSAPKTSRWASSRSTLPSPTGTALTTPSPSFPDSTKIAISITIPVAIIAILILGFILYRRRKRTPSDPLAPELDAQSNNILEMPVGVDPPKYELPAHTVPIPASYGAVEADSGVFVPPGHNFQGHIQPLVVSSTAQELETPVPIHSSAAHSTIGDEIEPWVSPAVQHTFGRLSDAEDEELQWIREEQEKLNERRERLKRLEEIDEANERLKQRYQERLSALGGRNL